MTGAELEELARTLDGTAYLLEDAERHATEWIAYLHNMHAGLTYRIADAATFRLHAHASLPDVWIDAWRSEHRPDTDEETAISFAELLAILAHDCTARYPLQALHITYHLWSPHYLHYRVTVLGPHGPRSSGTSTAYWALQGQPPPLA